MNSATHPAHASGQYLIGGDLSVYRLGYGTMQLTGPGHWYHPADPLVPLADQVGVLAEAQRAGKIRHVGLSKVSVAQIEEAVRIVMVAAVQNPYNVSEGDDDVLTYCDRHGIAFVPYRPLAAGTLARREQAPDDTATAAQAAISYLLSKSPNVLP